MTFLCEAAVAVVQNTAEAKRDLGNLEQAFVDRLVEEMSSFLLGGRAWLVVSLNHESGSFAFVQPHAGKSPAGAVSFRNS